MATGLLNRRHVALMLSCSTRTVDRLVERGELEYTRRWAGGHKCFTFAQMNKYLARCNERGDEYAKLHQKGGRK